MQINYNKYYACIADPFNATFNEGLRGAKGGPCSLLPNKISPCSLKVFSRFWCSLKYVFVPMFRKVNGHVPLFPETPGVAQGMDSLTFVKLKKYTDWYNKLGTLFLKQQPVDLLA